jgi:hypothetical protein
MTEARTITIDTLRPLRRASGAGVLYVGHLFCGLRSAIEEAVKRTPLSHSSSGHSLVASVIAAIVKGML